MPALLFTIPAGHWVDEFDRRRVLAASLAIQGAVALLLGWSSGGAWVSRDLILLLCVPIGLARALQLPSQQAIVPSLVSMVQLPRALSLNASMNKLATIAGPALGGFLYLAGPGVVYAVCTALLGVSMVLALTLALVRSPRLPEPISLASLFAGFGFVRDHRIVLGAVTLDLFAVLLGGVTALLPIYAKDILQCGPWGLGLLRAAPAVGGLVVSAWLTFRPVTRAVGMTMFWAVSVYGLATVFFSLSSHLWLSLALLTVVGSADMLSTVLRQTLVQIETPDALRGRVGAAHSMFIAASNQLGQFRAGAVAEIAGPVVTAVAGGMGTLCVAIACARGFPALRLRDTYRR